MKQIAALFIAWLVLPCWMGCGGDSPVSPPSANGNEIVEDAHPRIKIGMTQTEILNILGEPTRKRTFLKPSIPGFGEPSWWDEELVNGDAVEIWFIRTFREKQENHEYHESTNHTNTKPKRGVIRLR